MSRGLGKVQRMCLDVLKGSGKMLDSIEIAGRALDKREINHSEHASFRRALRKLADMGLIVNMTRHWHNNRRWWAMPEVAKRIFDREAKVFGRQAADERKAESRFTKDRYPGHA